MKDEIPLNEIKLFSLRPDQVGYETLISTIERLLEMALSRVNEQEGGEDYRWGLLMTAVSGVAKEAPPMVEAPMVKARREPNPPPKKP